METRCGRSASGREVEHDDLEGQLDALRSQVEDPRVGLYGPESILWEINREAVIFLGGGRAALLQLAHPYVAAAIYQHSNTRSDPFGRFRRTFTNVFAMVFGDLEEAFAAARRVHGVHRHITGTLGESLGSYAADGAYRANEPHALLWVHATLWESSIHVFERTVRRLSLEEKERYYQETCKFAGLFGLDQETLPTEWLSFEAYNREMWEQHLAVGRAAKEIGGFLFTPHLPGSTPAMRWLRLMTTGLLPAPLREEFGLRFSPRDRQVFEISLRAVWLTRRMLPRRLRYVPPYISALRRIAGNTRRDRLGEMLTRLWLGEGATSR